MIHHLQHNEIDKSKWDQCIDNAHNSLIYAKSIYLDHMADSWNGLVLGDYEAVMPIPVRKKWFIQYIYQPAFIQQLGIFSKDALSEVEINEFITVLQSQYRFAEFTLNYANSTSSINIKIESRNNFIRTLNKREVDFEFSSTYLQQRYRRSIKNNLSYQTSDHIEKVIALYKELYHKRLPYFTQEDYNKFKQLCLQLNTQEKVIVRLCLHEDKIVAALLMLKENKRFYNLVSCLTEDGKKLKANYFIYGKFIEEFSGHDEVLDLEGSDHPGIAFFYEKLSSAAQPYPFVRWNNLPFPLKWLK